MSKARIVQVYIATFFFSLHYAVVLYVHSSFLKVFFDTGTVSLLFILGALLSILVFLYTPLILDKIGGKRILVYALTLDYLALTGLIGASSPTVVALSFILYTATALIIPYCLDIFLEAYTNEAETGRVRGTNLTIGNLAICLAPLILSILASNGDFSLMYIASALFLVPLILLSSSFAKTSMPSESHHSFHILMRMWMMHSDIRRVTLVRLMLESFYTIMVIFMPLYLYSHIGFSWQEIGIIFAIMLTPFVLFGRPLGWLADCFYGEKEIMSAGLCLMAGSLLIMPHLGSSMTAWVIVLFLSRIGAAAVEVMTESFFFKQVGKDDTGLISIFRLTRPKATILGALVGIVLIAFYSYQTLFYTLAAMMILGTLWSARIKDSR